MDTIDKVREFNRFYTRQTGLVGRNYVSGELNLSELRVLYELGQPNPSNARLLARELGLDEGYLSRILGSFTKKKWLQRKPDPSDQRVSLLRLTPEGQAQADTYIHEARDRIGQMLAAMDGISQRQIVDAMMRIQRIFSGSTEDVELRDIQSGDIGWLIQQHAELYVMDEGFNSSFEVLVAKILTDFLENRRPERERAFIATRGSERLGSIFCVHQSNEIAKLRLFLLVREARGLGLGKQLIDACMNFARDTGYQRLVLWTHKSHEAACALYLKFGFEMTSEEPVHEFGVDLIRQNWEITL